MRVLVDHPAAKRALAVLALTALAACSGARPGPGGALPPSPAAQSVPGGRTAQDAAAPGETAQGLPGETAQGLPGETAQGLPGETAQGLPGETAQGLPGAQFGCTDLPAQGGAKCTIAINLSIGPSADPNLPATLIPGFHPADLAAAYALPVQNAGGTVAVVDAFDDPAAEIDLAVYRAAFGLPPCTTANGCFRKLNQTGAAGSYPAPDLGWAQETALDLEMVSAACPRCSILLVEASSAQLDDLGAAVDTAAANGARAISNSYYAPEWSGEANEDVHYRHAGIAITASSGDRGYPSYPAASRYVTSVGGTSLQRSGGGWSESAWSYTGHGCSAYVAAPSFQNQAATRCRTRSAVDVAAVADPATGVAMFQAASGGWLVAGGTSVGAPLIASAYALAGRGHDVRAAYQNPGAFHDVAPSGYDAITGLGTPSGIGGF
jgi:hypothetical protein